jgi:hypothetical protein
MQFTRSNSTSNEKPGADRCCKSGIFGFLAFLGLCFSMPFLFGSLGLAFLSPYLDRYVLLPLMVICLVVVLYGWLRGGKIVRRN